MFSDRKPLIKRAVLSVLLLLFVVSAQVSAEEGDRPNANKNYAGHPHCGLYCL